MNRVDFRPLLPCDCECLHATWHVGLKDELRKIVEFIRAGGLEKAREREIEDLEHARSLERADHASAPYSIAQFLEHADATLHGSDLAFDAIGAALNLFLKR